MAGLPIQTLLYIGLFADDAGFQNRKIGRRRGGEVLRNVFRKVTAETWLRPAGPAGVCARDRRMEQADLREVTGQPFHLDQHAACQSAERAARDRHFDISPLTFAQGRHRCGAIPGEGEQNLVIVDGAVIGRVEDVCVQAIFVGAKIQNAQSHLFGRAVGSRHIRPTRGICGLGSRKSSLSGEPGRMIELQTECGCKGGAIVGADVVGRNPAAREKRAEIHGRTVDHTYTSTGPFDLGNLLTASFGRLGQGFCLEHPAIESRCAVGKGCTIDMKGIIGRSVHARPGTGCQAVPARSRIGRCLSQKSIICSFSAGAQQTCHRGHQALVCKIFNHILSQAIRGEKYNFIFPGCSIGSRRCRYRN